MAKVKKKPGEAFDSLIRRFKRACERAGILAEAKRRQHHEKDSERRKREAANAVKRHQKQLAKTRPVPRTERVRLAKKSKARFARSRGRGE